MFVDQVNVHLRGGDGGAGVASFHREKGKPRGRPEGGSGGNGGAVFLVATPDMPTLLTYRRNPHHRAGSGTHGEGDMQHGKRGADVTLPVPLGTMVFSEDGELIADLVEEGQSIRVRDGGNGGRGNHALASKTHRVPGFSEQGEYGEEATYRLELKLLADAALIGFPNAGKSTLISKVSAAKPKIADYPFTTLQPNLGVVSVEEHEFVMADIPGLIEGAAEGKGLGHEFLRHVERARVLVVLLDPSLLQTEAIEEQYQTLLGELEAHDSELLERPRLVVLTKGDIETPPDLVEMAEDLGVDRVFPICSLTGDGLDELMYAIAEEVQDVRREVIDREGFILHRPAPAPFEVFYQDGMWLVEGKAARRAVNLADLTDLESADVVADRLERIGVNDALANAGAVSGDEVMIGDIVFVYEPETAWIDEDDEDY